MLVARLLQDGGIVLTKINKLSIASWCCDLTKATEDTRYYKRVGSKPVRS